ncbi:MAG: hydrolase Nlp/P60 [Flavobacteriaceae bacterium]|nr:MAG: hydrolase Nlp/P60 [Flavobacteriaceae bacterium]
MKIALCQVSVAPLRAQNADSSEMVSQILFGEFVEILEQKDKWWKVQVEFDGYQGWIDPKQVLEISEEIYQSLRNIVPSFVSDVVGLAIDHNQNPLMLSYGSVLPGFVEQTIDLGTQKINYQGSFTQIVRKEKSDLVEIAMNYINAPYLWGGKSVFGIDCSGFSQQVYKMAGYKLPRDAYQQAELGSPLGFVAEAMAGDLAFFENPQGKIIHVGIMLEDQKIIHAHGKVRVDPIDDTGIFNHELNRYTHKLRFVKSLID